MSNSLNKEVYDLPIIEKTMGIDSFLKLHIPTSGVTAVSVRCYDGFSVRDNGREIYVNGIYDGTDTNSIGPYGSSDYWAEDDDGQVIDTCPDEDSSIFIDGCFGVIVVRRHLPSRR